MSADNVTPISGAGSPESPKSPKARAPKVAATTVKFGQDDGDLQPDMLLLAIKYQFQAIEEMLSGVDPAQMCPASYLAMGGQVLAQGLVRRYDEANGN